MAAVLGGIANFAFRIDAKQQRAQSYYGNRTLLMHITEQNFVSEHSSAYTVKIESISGNNVTYKAVLISTFPLEMSVGDTLRGTFELKSTDEEVAGMSASKINSDADVLLSAVLYEPNDAEIKRFRHDLPWYRYIFEDNGLSVLVSNAKGAITGRMDKLFGEDSSALAKAFLLGDKSDISAEAARDFRRTGLSHIFAVSGMHISILLGTLELIMRKLCLHKYIRIAIVSIAAIPMLALTGFAMSAVRSVLMLWIVYMFFVISEDSDGPTRLFVSITIILIILPYSVYDLGLWMSFLATLAIVTIFADIQEKFHKRKHEKLYVKILRNILMIAIMTVLCSMFLLPIQCYVFGEMSLVSIPANILISPLASVYMIATIIALIIGSVPLLGGISIFAVQGTGKIITLLVGALSRLNFATVSLRYKFADILVILFTVAFVAVLVLKLKHKWLVALPAAGFAVAFSVCVCVFHFSAPQSVTYYCEGTNQIIAVSQAEDLTVVDMSNGKYSRYKDTMDNALKTGSTTLDKLVFTQINENHLSSMDYFFSANIVNNIYIPTPTDEHSMYMAVRMARLADEHGIKVFIYDNTVKHEDILIKISNKTDGESTECAVFVCSEKRTLGIIEPAACESENIQNAIVACDTVIVGNRSKLDKPYKFALGEGATLIYSNEQVQLLSQVQNQSGNSYRNIKEKFKVNISLK